MSGLFLVKVAVSALVIALASEIAKRDSFWGALLVALPLTSVLAVSWLVCLWLQLVKPEQRNGIAVSLTMAGLLHSRLLTHQKLW